MISATLRLYADAAKDAAKALPRTWLAMVALIGGNLVVLAALLFIGTLPGQLGMIAGFGVGFLAAAAIGWYLALLSVGVVSRRSLALSDLREALGVYMWDVISVLFLFWIASLLLGMTLGNVGVVQLGPIAMDGSWMVAVLFAVASVLFNPAPELIYQGRTRSTELLADAARFMQQSWPEWLVPHAIIVAVLIGIDVAFSGASWSLMQAFGHLETFGPQFGFGLIALQGLGISLFGAHSGEGALTALTLVQLGITVVITHFWMLFRGALFYRLRSSSRRSRAWEARLR